MSNNSNPNRTEIKLEFIGTAGVNPFIANTSSPRAVMDSSHMSSRVSLINPEPVIVQTGIEYELGKYINDVRTEHNCVVKASIPKFQNGALNTETILIVEYEKDGHLWLDLIEVPEYKSSHGYFGYKLKPTADFLNMEYNSVLPKDTLLAAASSYGEDGTYNYSLNANVAFMSHPSVAEDGIVISESFAKRLQFTMVTKRVINLTKETIPLNLYGDKELFKFLPDIGEAVRPDGLLCATRSRNDWFSVVEMNDENICMVDSTFDNPVYVPKNSVVTDITVIRGNYGKEEFPRSMTLQLDHYAEGLVNYYRNIVSRYDKILAEKKAMYGDTSDIRQTGRLRRFIADCMIKVNAATTGKTKLTYRKLPIDQHRIEVTVSSVVTPNVGFKLTDVHASKGVVCRILPDHCMPVDSLGNRADVITDSNSTISRMNLGRAYHHYIGAFSRDNKHRLINHFQIKYGPEYMNRLNKEDIDYAMSYMHSMYRLLNSDLDVFVASLNEEEREHHVKSQLSKEIVLYYPPDNEKNIVDVIEEIENTDLKPHLGKVTYVDEYGVTVTTEDDIRIGNMPILLLDKVAFDYAAVSSAKVNSFNFPIKGSNIDKHRYPHNLTPTTTLSETEVRILASFADPVMLAEMVDLAMNPVSHKLLVKGILESDKAYDPNFDIPRDIADYGNTKSLGLLRHIFAAAGFDIRYLPENIIDAISHDVQAVDDAVEEKEENAFELSEEELFEQSPVVAEEEISDAN